MRVLVIRDGERNRRDLRGSAQLGMTVQDCKRLLNARGYDRQLWAALGQMSRIS